MKRSKRFAYDKIIREAAEKGMRPREILELVPGMANCILSRILRRNGFNNFPRGPQKSEASIENQKLARQWKGEGCSYSEIGNRLGITHQRVQQFFKKDATNPKPTHCPSCGNPTASERMHMHHIDYLSGKTVWLCIICHAHCHPPKIKNDKDLLTANGKQS